MYNAELINMTMDEMVATGGGESIPWCFYAGAAAVLTVAGVATGNIVAAGVGAFALGFTGAACIDS